MDQERRTNANRGGRSGRRLSKHKKTAAMHFFTAKNRQGETASLEVLVSSLITLVTFIYMIMMSWLRRAISGGFFCSERNDFHSFRFSENYAMNIEQMNRSLFWGNFPPVISHRFADLTLVFTCQTKSCMISPQSFLPDFFLRPQEQIFRTQKHPESRGKSVKKSTWAQIGVED